MNKKNENQESTTNLGKEQKSTKNSVGSRIASTYPDEGPGSSEITRATTPIQLGNTGPKLDTLSISFPWDE